MNLVSALDVAVDCLAAARIVKLVQDDDIPFGRLREWVLDRYGDHKAADLLSCGWCLSVHVGAAVVLARHRWPRAWGYAARVLAASQVTGELGKR